MPTPLDAIVADLVTKLDSNLREAFEERAAIIEFDSGLPRAHAECLGLLNVLRRYPAALTGITTLRFELQGSKPCLLTTNLAVARQRLTAMGGVEQAVVDLATVVQEDFDGLAHLTPVK